MFEKLYLYNVTTIKRREYFVNAIDCDNGMDKMAGACSHNTSTSLLYSAEKNTIDEV